MLESVCEQCRSQRTCWLSQCPRAEGEVPRCALASSCYHCKVKLRLRGRRGRAFVDSQQGQLNGREKRSLFKAMRFQLGLHKRFASMPCCVGWGVAWAAFVLMFVSTFEVDVHRNSRVCLRPRTPRCMTCQIRRRRTRIGKCQTKIMESAYPY